METREAAGHPTIHKTVPTTRNCSAPNANSVEIDEIHFRLKTKQKTKEFFFSYEGQVEAKGKRKKKVI